jgi:hypothetical protein
MKKNSIFLLASAVLFWASLIVVDALPKGLSGWLIFLFYVSTVVLTAKSAKEKGMNVIGMTIWAIFIPFVTPFIVVFSPSQKEKTTGVFIAKSIYGKNILSVNGKHLTVSQFMGKEFTFNLEELRYVYATIPGKFWTVLVQTSQKLSCFDLDDMSDAEYYALTAGFEDAMQKAGILGGLSGYIICIADFNNNYAQVNFKEIKSSGIPFFSLVGKYRAIRQQVRQEWLKTNPRIEMRGKLWMSAILDRTGFYRGSKSFKWKDVEMVRVQTTNDMVADLYFKVKGKGSFMGMGKYGMRIPMKRKDIYMAECQFWRLLAEKPALEEIVSN